MNKLIQALRRRAMRHPDTTEGIAARLGFEVGKHGWVIVKLDRAPPLARLEEWVDESYRAVAGPKTKQKKK